MALIRLAGRFVTVHHNGGRSWTGFHAGLNAALHNSAKLDGGRRRLLAMVQPHALFAGEAPNQKIRALSFGAQAGYDYQFGNRLEQVSRPTSPKSGGRKSRLSGALSQMRLDGYCPAIICSGSVAFEAVRKADIDWISTVRGRLGYAVQ